MPTDWRTRLIHPSRRAPEGFRSLATATHRGSTTLFGKAADLEDNWKQREGYTYGLFGTPTARELALRVAELEGAEESFLAPSGLAAIALVWFAFARSGAHVLVPDNVYTPNRVLADDLARRFGVEVEFYDPLCGGDIAGLLREETVLVWCESPGSVTMEIQDVPAIAAAAHARGARVALDNTYAGGVLFDAFTHGADISMQALTKYVGGHSDLLMGAVSARDPACREALDRARRLLGLNVSPDDCALALRGLQTLGVRLAQLEASALAVARWLDARPEIETVLHPALPSCPGHDIWRRDWSGSASLFSVVFDARFDRTAIEAFVDRLRLFGIGYSWGGVASLALPHFQLHRHGRGVGERLVRFNIGLEAVDDLIADLAQALEGVGGVSGEE
ncbi:cystathionine beta-lyase [Coralloluteibacterium thermophilus]|uniref:Cystathionine beta-lyase n=1 Tax=Coralloluteibacterium thermophilum TaxID=2707049 RepID=A0ABV9NME4_9GAMM